MKKNMFELMRSEDVYAITTNRLKQALLVVQNLPNITSLVNGLEVVTFQTSPGNDDYKFAQSLFCIAEYIQYSRGSDYKYSFLSSAKGLLKFLTNNGLITITHKNGLPMSINFSLIEEVDEEVNLLVAGLTIAARHSVGIPIFYYSNLSLIKYSILMASENEKKCFISTMINDGKSFEFFHRFTGDTCFPFVGNSVSRKNVPLYKSIAKKTFELYVKENFPNAKVCLNTHIVTSNKAQVGFNDSFSTSSLDSSLRYSCFIKNWISDFSKEDILLVGLIDEVLLKSLNKELGNE